MTEKRPGIFFLCTLILILAALASTFPAQGAEVRKTTLPNGLTVLLQENNSIPVITVFVTYRVGSRNEQLGRTGISHLLEHMLFRGTKKYPPGRISRMLNVAGAEFNAYTTYDVTSYYETLPSGQLSLALDIEADRMAHCTLDPELVASEKEVVLAELEGYENSPRDLLYNGVLGLHFTAHPYHWPVGGYKNDVAAITRDDLVHHYRTYYNPCNAVLTISGDMKADDALEHAKRFFGPIPKGMTPPKVRSIEPPQGSEKRVVLSRKGTTSYVKVAYHTPSIRDRDIYALALMDALLAKGKSSRLYRALVEKGFATGLSSTLWDNRDPGMYAITLTIAPGREHKEVERALLSELDRFGTGTIQEEEFRKAENLVKADFFRTKESLTLQAEYLSWYEAIHTYRYLESYMDRIHRVKPEEVQGAARKYLSANNRTIGWFRGTGSTTSSQDAPSVRTEGIYGAGTGKNTGARLPAHPARPPQKKAFTFSRALLPNGMTLLIRENHSTPTVSISGYVKAGGVFDPAGKEGLANFTASMLERGGTQRRSSREISQELDSLGSSLSCAGGRETASIQGWSLSANLDKTLSLLAESLTEPLFPADDCETVRTQISSQLAQQADDPETLALLSLRELIYPEGNPYRSNTKGYPRTISAISPSDMAQFHRTHYRPDRTVLCITGDVKTETIRAQLERLFSPWKAEGKAPEFTISPVELPREMQKKLIPMKDKSQVAVALGNRAMSRGNKDYYAFHLLNDILGGNTLTSRLGDVLREKEGLVYGVWSFLVDSQGEGPWIILYGTGEKNVAKSLERVKSTVQKIQNSPVSTMELEEARSSLVNRIAVSLETNGRVADMLCDMEYFKLGDDYLEKLPGLYGAVTRDDLTRVARQYIQLNKMSLVIAGPEKEQ